MNKMFRLILLTLAFMLSACAATTAEYGAADTNNNEEESRRSISVEVTTADVYVNEQLISLDQPALIANERTLVPLRAICEQLDCSVEWNDSSKTAAIRNKYVNIVLQNNNYTATKKYTYDPSNPEKIKLVVPPIIYNDRTYVPVRFVAESLNADVSWDDSSKRVDIRPKYTKIVSEFDETSDCAIIWKGDGFDGYFYSSELFGAIDTHGNIIIEPTYDNIDIFSNELAAVCKNFKWGFADRRGNVVIPLVYDDVGNFSEDGIVNVQKGDKYFFIDKSGNQVFDNTFNEAHSFSEGLAAVKINDKYGFVDKTGMLVIPAIYDNAYSFSEGLAIIEEGNKWGIIDKDNTKIVPAIYYSIHNFCNGYAVAHMEDETCHKCGFINKNGDFVAIFNEVMDDYYIDMHDICDFNENGLAAASVDKYSDFGFVNTKGEIVIPFVYDSIDCFDVYPNRMWNGGVSVERVLSGKFYEGLTRVCKWGKDGENDKWGFIDEKGNEVIPLIYDYVWNFKNGEAKVQKDGLVYYIDINGNRV